MTYLTPSQMWMFAEGKCLNRGPRRRDELAKVTRQELHPMRVVWGGIWDELCLVLCGLSGSRDFCHEGLARGTWFRFEPRGNAATENPSIPTFFKQWLRKQTCLVHGMWHS